MTTNEEKHERQVTELIKERDYLESMCDKLAAAIAPADVLGEHSSMNDPWANALEYAEARQASRARKLERGQYQHGQQASAHTGPIWPLGKIEDKRGPDPYAEHGGEPGILE